jgi:hypothetical protein
MMYWGNEEDAGDNEYASMLIAHSDGGCGGWSRLFQRALAFQGITNSTLWVVDPPANMAEMGIYASIPAQGNPQPRNHFNNHAVVQFGQIIYDPSYGRTYTNQLQWEDSSVSVYYPSFDLQNPTNDVKGRLDTRWQVTQ